MTTSWKVTLPCTRAEAEALKEDISPLALLDFPPVLMTSEADASSRTNGGSTPISPRSRMPTMLAHLAALVPSARGARPVVEQVEERDWVTLSQAGLEPIRAGRFFVHTPAHRDIRPPDAIGLEIDAGRAFGTGQHETTSGCLIALSRLQGRGRAASPTCSTSAPAPASSPSPRSSCGRRAGDRLRHRSGGDRGARRECGDQRCPARAARAAGSSSPSPPASSIAG